MKVAGLFITALISPPNCYFLPAAGVTSERGQREKTKIAPALVLSEIAVNNSYLGAA